MTRRNDPEIAFECDGCDGTATVRASEAVVVEAPGVLAFVATCPCGTVKVDDQLAALARVTHVVTRVTIVPERVPAFLAPIDEAEVTVFVTRLAWMPDGGRAASPSLSRRFVGRAVTAQMWAELRGDLLADGGAT